jgi:putative transposase
MPRHPRLDVIDFPQHVVIRGVDRRTCFLDDRDRETFLAWLFDYGELAACEVNAFVLMTNHVHLLLTGRRERSISKYMQCVGRRYVRYFNDRHGRTGPLFEGRFRSSLVTTDAYAIACLRYIDLNPVRAGLATSPVRYGWSTCVQHAYGVPRPGWTPHVSYLALGSTGPARTAAYRALLETPLSPHMLDSIRNGLRRGRPLADNADPKIKTSEENA